MQFMQSRKAGGHHRASIQGRQKYCGCRTDSSYFCNFELLFKENIRFVASDKVFSRAVSSGNPILGCLGEETAGCGGLLPHRAQEICVGDIANIVRDLEGPLCRHAPRMYDTLGNLLPVELAKLLREVIVLKQHRSTGADGFTVEIALHRVALVVSLRSKGTAHLTKWRAGLT